MIRPRISVPTAIAGLIIAAIALVPVWSVHIPPLADYPNHLVRAYIIANISGSDDLRNYYEVRWSATPYLAMDAIIVAFANVTSVIVAGKVFLSIMLLLLATASIGLSISLHGRVTAIALLGPLFVHNSTTSLGFVNYLFSLGFAFSLFAVWVYWRNRYAWAKLLVFPILATGLFLSHLIGFLVYVLLLLTTEIHHQLRFIGNGAGAERTSETKNIDLTLIVIGLQVLVPAAVFILFGPSGETSRALSETTHGGLLRKIDLLIGMPAYLMPPYLWTMDRVVATAIPILLMVLFLARRIQVAPQMRLPLAAFLAVFLAMPMEWLGGWGGDHRLLPALGILLVASIRPKSGHERAWRIASACILVLVVVRTIAVTMEWRRADEVYTRMVRSFAVLAAGSKVYYAFGYAEGREFWRPRFYIPTLAVIQRQVYVPYLFTSATINGVPMRYKEPFEQLQLLSAGPILLNGQSPNWAAIKDQYDYFIVGGQKHFSSSVPSDLTEVYRGDDLAVYQNLSMTPHGRP